MENMYTVGDGKTFLEPAQIRRLPSINAHHAATMVSEKYNFFNTLNVVEMLSREKWLPVMMQEQRVQTEGRRGYQKHMVRFRRPDVRMDNVGDIAPELILTNSHDTLSAYIFMLGIFRKVCTNGAVISEAQFPSIHIRHMGFEEEDVLEASFKVIEDVPRLMDKIGQYKSITLNAEEKFAFAESALVMKFANDDDSQLKRNGANVTIGDRSFSLQDLLRPRRYEDELPTLWNAFNTIQEKFTKGNTFERTVRRNEETGKITKVTKVRGIKGIDESIRVNKGLWHLQELMRELKTPAIA